MGVIGKGAVARYLGVIGVLIPLAVSFYYVFIEAWCLGYAWHYLTGGIGVDAARADRRADRDAPAPSTTTSPAATQNGVLYRRLDRDAGLLGASPSR